MMELTFKCESFEITIRSDHVLDTSGDDLPQHANIKAMGSLFADMLNRLKSDDLLIISYMVSGVGFADSEGHNNGDWGDELIEFVDAAKKYREESKEQYMGSHGAGAT